MKITLKEFFGTRGELYIHCDTKEKANRLLKEFKEAGEYYWANGEGYLNNTQWNMYKENTCYSNKNFLIDLDSCQLLNYKIYEFEDVIFDSELVNISNKETPMKVTKRKYRDTDYNGEPCWMIMGECPKCERIFGSIPNINIAQEQHNYCSCCGQKLDWSNLDEKENN